LNFFLNKVKKYKLKNKSSAKKRFKFSSTGKVILTQANKRHNLRKRSNRQIRENRGTTVACRGDEQLVRKYLYQGLMP
jgi:large subunit ribosomal protein L35